MVSLNLLIAPRNSLTIFGLYKTIKLMQLKMVRVRYACTGTNTDGGHPSIPPPLGKIASIILISIVMQNFSSVYVVSGATRRSLRHHKFSGGACMPIDPLIRACYHTL